MPTALPTDELTPDHVFPEFLTEKQVLELFKISRPTALEWRRLRGCPHTHVGRLVRYGPRDALMEWFAAELKQTPKVFHEQCPDCWGEPRTEKGKARRAKLEAEAAAAIAAN